MQQLEESGGDIVIVGAGLAGLAVALGLHRKGVRSVVLESSPALRASGFAFAVWPNAFRALDALGVGDKIRSLHVQAEGLRITSSSTGEVARELDFLAPQGKQGGGHFEFESTAPAAVDPATADADQDRVEILDEGSGRLDIGRYVDHVRDLAAGAIATFEGTTRDHFDGRRVVELRYEAYSAMARRRLEAILRVVPHFPKQGIMFNDITALLLRPGVFKDAVDMFVERYRGMSITAVAVTHGAIYSFEFRCVRRDVLLQILAAELPRGTIRYSSKIVSIDEEHGDGAKIIQLADGSTLRAKVLIGCDGINSVVSKWLGLAKPSYSGRSAARGLAHYPDGHTFQHKFLQFFGQGFRFGYVPCNANDVYWFYTWSPSPDEEGVDKSGAKMKQYVLTKLRSSKVPTEALELVQMSELSDDAPATPLRFRSPFSLLFAEISKGNVCVAGDALHPMTPDLGQGGCAALEDGVVLARCLGEAILGGGASTGGVTQKERIESGLQKYAGIRRWRSIQLIGTAYTVGFFQQSGNVIISFLREKVLAGVLAGRLVKMTKYDCGTLAS